MNQQINFRKTVFLTIIFCSMFSFIMWDKVMLDKEFQNTFTFLNQIRHNAIYQNRQIAVKFNDEIITTSDNRSLIVPRLWRVRYDTTLGNNMIVFDSLHGTNAYNLRVHGGDLSIRSYSRLFQKHIAVNCAGFVSEGLYPEY